MSALPGDNEYHNNRHLPGKHLAAAYARGSVLSRTGDLDDVAPGGSVGDAIVGGPIAQSDGWQKVWNIWWLQYAFIPRHRPILYQSAVLAAGGSLGFQPIDVTNTAAGVALAAVAGPVAAYGVAAILGFALSGFITYLLGLRVVGSVAGALAAGMMVTIAPNTLIIL
ncbi:MAG: hypothetical protein HC893_08795 [Chloroflexaceae bacterium]|nr:hypothetical protein [Chloroflexaceae bacterium]